MDKNIINNEHAVLIVACAGAINQELYLLIELLSKEIQLLKSFIGRRMQLSRQDKCRLAALSNKLERRILILSAHVVTIDSLRRWYRELIANTYTAKNRGRPKVSKEIELLTCKLARENPHWGEDSIRDRLRTLGHQLSDRTVSNILKRNGVPPALEREKSNDWSRFLKDHWPNLYAIDFATFEIPERYGKRTRRCHALYAMHLRTRQVKLLGVRTHADGKWATQLIRNECHENGFFRNATDLIMDRDPLYCHSFKEVLRTSNIRPKVLPPKSPNLNAFIERFIGTVRKEACRNLIPFSEESLRLRLSEHVAYYNQERNHQSLKNNSVPDPCKHDAVRLNKGPIKRSSRLGNTLNYYYRTAN